jgi:hypothetical protein
MTGHTGIPGTINKALATAAGDGIEYAKFSGKDLPIHISLGPNGFGHGKR